MKLYFSIIGTSMLIISVLNIIFSVASWYNVIIAVILCTALQFVLDGVVAIIINSIPDKFFRINNVFNNVTPAEIKLYKKLKVRSWKDKVWELGSLGGFSKKNLLNYNSSEYIEKFIVECNKGVITHMLSYPVGFIAIIFLPGLCKVTIALPVAVINLLLNILPTIVLRYNIPKLHAALNRIYKKSKDTYSENSKEKL